VSHDPDSNADQFIATIVIIGPKYGVTPYGTTGNTEMPSGSAASAATRSGRMLR
jgi:hypothetical protein